MKFFAAATAFSMLTVVAPAQTLSAQPPTLEERIVDIEVSIAGESLEEFQGIAGDPGGMGIAQIKIAIFQRARDARPPWQPRSPHISPRALTPRYCRPRASARRFRFSK